MMISNVVFKAADYPFFKENTPSYSSWTQNIGLSNFFFNIFIQKIKFCTSLSNGMKAQKLVPPLMLHYYK